MYDWVILGATSLALGLAGALSAEKQQVLVIDKTEMVASEFVAAFRPGKSWSADLQTALARSIRDAMIGQGLLAGDTACTHAAGSLFYRAYHALPADLLLDTAIMAIRTAQSGYELDCHAAGSHMTVKTRAIFDTTADRITLRTKSLHAILACQTGEAPEPQADGCFNFRLDTVLEPPAVILEMPCPIDESLIAARHRLIERFTALPEAGCWKIAAIANCFAETPLAEDVTPDPGFPVLPSCRFDNPLLAIDAGWMQGEKAAEKRPAKFMKYPASQTAAPVKSARTAEWDSCIWIDGPHKESASGVTFDLETQIVVAGVGTAGAYAVWSAARQGAAVIGIDKQPGVGGMGTYGYVSGYYYGAAGGLHVSLDQEAETLAKNTFVDTVEAKKYLLEQKAMAAGATFLFSARVVGVYLEADVVRGVAVWTEGRLIRIACDLAIDATAEAELCRAAGCAIEFGRASDGQVRPFTSVKVWLNNQGRIARTNHDSGYVNQLDPFALSDGICSAHKNQLLDSFHEDRTKVLFLAPMIGIREGCRIVSHRNITMQAILEGDFDPEPLFYAYADFDKHGKDHALESEQMLDWYVACNLSTACLSVPISARSLVPQELANVITAGRHIGVDHDAASLVRMKRDMHKCGEAAGVLAALTVQSGVRPLDVPYANVRAILSQSGCLNPEHQYGVRFDDSYCRHTIEWLQDPADIRQTLSTDKPGIALYSCRLLGEKITHHLIGWLADPDPMLSNNSALALGLQGRKESLPVLHRIVQNRDSFYFKDCRRTNQLRTAMAIYLIGRCGDRSGISLLREILCDPEEYKKPLYSDIRELTYAFSLTKNFNEVYFQIVSQAALAVVRIMAKSPGQTSFGAAVLEEAFQTDRHIRNTTTMPEGTYEYATMANIRDYVLKYAAKAAIT